jgi:MoxR-like ATPase
VVGCAHTPKEDSYGFATQDHPLKDLSDPPLAAKTPEVAGDDDLARVELLHRAYKDLTNAIEKVVVGQRQVVELLLIALFSGGHSILVGVPGLAKTLLVSTLARLLALSFKRIQFTPDLMPSDITGTDILQEDPQSGLRGFRFLRGPVFANMVLADEINRTPPKTQAALLEAMQERHVTVGDRTLALPAPFFVVATQNPIEQEGTYPLPEAQQDRFMFKVFVRYPSWVEEREVIRRTTSDRDITVEPVIGADEIERIQSWVRKIPVADPIIDYAMKLVRQTRHTVLDENPPEFVRDAVAWGAGPRACQFIILGAKARALLLGRHYVAIEDVQAMAAPVLRHRILTNFQAEARGIDADRLIQQLIETTPTEEGAILPDGQLRKVLRS